MLFQSSLGIAIGETQTAIVHLKRSLRGIKVAAHAVFPLAGDRPAGENLKSLTEVVGMFLRQHRIPATGVFIGIPRNETILRYIELPAIAKDDLRSTLGYEMEKYVPLSGEDLSFDYQVISGNRDSNTLEVLLIAAKKQAVSGYVEVGQKLGLGIYGVEIHSTAVANYFAYLGTSSNHAPYVIGYKGENHFELNVVRRNQLIYSRSIDLTKRDEDFDIELRRNLLQVQKTLGEEHGRLELILCDDGVGEAQLKSLKEETDFHINQLDPATTGLPSSALIPAFGLALKGLHKTPLQINLMPLELRSRPRMTGRIILMVLLGLTVLLSLAWGGSSILQEKMELDRLNVQLGNLKGEISQVDAVRQSCNEVEERISYLEKQYRGHISVLEMLRDLSERVPEGAWVRDFRFSRRGLELKGFADEATELIQLLEESPLFRDAAFLSPIVKAKDGKESFLIGLKVGRED